MLTPNIQNPAIGIFEKMVLRDIKVLEIQWYHNSNLSRKNREILTLSSNENIIIKEADKGGVVAVLNREDYCNEINHQFSDTSFY